MRLDDIAGIQSQLVNYARAVLPEEMCGLIVRDDLGNRLFYATPNRHSDRLTDFAISAEDYAEASKLGEIEAIAHSHTDATIYNGKLDFSQADTVACNAINLPWVLVVMPQEQIKIMNPTGDRLPLLGREFKYGVVDCYTLIRDAFAEIDIALNDFPRGEIYEWNTNPLWNLYEENFEKEGFEILPNTAKLQKYDLLLMQIESDRINHAGLMWDCDRNIFIHHLIDRYSQESVYGGYWRNCTIKAARHGKLINRN